MSDLPAKSVHDYADLLTQVKSRIRQAQTKANILPADRLLEVFRLREHDKVNAETELHASLRALVTDVSGTVIPDVAA